MLDTKLFITHFIFCISTLVFVSACTPAPTSPQDTSAQESPSVTPKKDAQTPQKRVFDDEITINYIYDRKYAHQNEYYTLRRYSTGYETEDGVILPQDALNNLKLAATEGLLPADKLYLCKSNAQRPQLQITFNHDGKAYKLIASSRCLHWAPWNIFVEGKAYVQINGNVGKQLAKILETLNPKLFKDPKLTPGLLDWAQPGLPLPETILSQESPSQKWQKQLEDSPEFKNIFHDPDGNPLEMADFKILCNQKNNEDCATLYGFAKLKLADSMFYPLSFTSLADTLTLNNPPKLFPDMYRFAHSKLAEELKTTTNTEFWFTLDKEPDCNAIRLAAPTVLPKIKDKSPEKIGCSRYLVTPKNTELSSKTTDILPINTQETSPNSNQKLEPPTLLVYPGLKAAWILFDKTKNSPELLKKLSKSKNIRKYTEEKTILFATESGKLHLLK